eukprot:PhF_6_TR1062/c0_g1_i2/m.2234/K00108/betA, CHDH; choline dehydrogenase
MLKTTSAGAVKDKIFDVIVVGAGAAGCIVASRLAQEGLNTLVVERGSLPTAASNMPFTSVWGLSPDVVKSTTTTPQSANKNEPVMTSSASVFGGATVTGETAWVRPQMSEYDTWGFPEWSGTSCYKAFTQLEAPVKIGQEKLASSVLPTISVSKSAYHCSLYKGISTAATAMGYHICQEFTPPPSGRGVFGRTSVNVNTKGERGTAVNEWLLRAAADPRTIQTLQACPNTTVEKILFSKDKASVTGVVVSGGDVIPCGRVVMCAGAIETPSILLRSGVGEVSLLEAAGIQPIVPLNAVGKNLFDVPSSLMRFNTTEEAVGLSSDAMVNAAIQLEWKLRSRGWGATDFSDFQFFLHSTANTAKECSDINLLVHPYGARGKANEISIQTKLALPRSRGAITITKDGVVSVNPAYLQDKQDQQTFAEGQAIAAEIFAKGVKGTLVANDAEKAPLLYSTSQCGGTCRLGEDVEKSVVGATNLR